MLLIYLVEWNDLHMCVGIKRWDNPLAHQVLLSQDFGDALFDGRQIREQTRVHAQVTFEG